MLLLVSFFQRKTGPRKPHVLGNHAASAQAGGDPQARAQAAGDKNGAGFGAQDDREVFGEKVFVTCGAKTTSSAPKETADLAVVVKTNATILGSFVSLF